MASTWIFLSLVSAFSLAASDALTKKALTGNNEYLVAWSRLLFSVPLLAILWIFVPIPDLDAEFYQAFLLAMPLEILALVFYIKALKASPLSLTLPFLSLTPVFLIGISYIMLEEKVSLQGAAGIFLIAAGGYMLNIHTVRKGFLEPFRAVTREKGSVFMILVAMIYSVTSSLGKLAIEHSSPLFFGITYFITLTIVFTPIALIAGRKDAGDFIGQKRYIGLFAPGLFYSAMIASHMIAISLTNVAYMISIKRMSVIIGVIFGYYLFMERNIRERLAGAFLMFSGFALIVTAS